MNRRGKKSTKLAVICLWNSTAQPLCRRHPRGPRGARRVPAGGVRRAAHQSWLWYGRDARHNHFVSNTTLALLSCFWASSKSCASASLVPRWHIAQPNSSKMAVIWWIYKTQPFLRMGHGLSSCSSPRWVAVISVNRPHQSGCDMNTSRHFTAALTG